MKIMLCVALHLYFGPVDAIGSKVVELTEECKAVSFEKARKAIQKCAAETPMTCETIIAKDRSRIIIEHKIQIAGDPNQ